jgi:methyl-accepting chemotaxis protein
MTNGQTPDLSADPLRSQAEALAASIRERCRAVNDVGERTAQAVVSAVESFATQTEDLMRFMHETAANAREATAAVSQAVGRAPAPAIDVDKLEREIQPRLSPQTRR